MAHLKSSIKKAARAEDLEKQNKGYKSKVKRVIKDTLENLTAENVRSATSVIDKAGAKRIIHKNAARRQKSRIARRANAATAPKS